MENNTDNSPNLSDGTSPEILATQELTAAAETMIERANADGVLDAYKQRDGLNAQVVSFVQQVEREEFDAVTGKTKTVTRMHKLELRKTTSEDGNSGYSVQQPDRLDESIAWSGDSGAAARTKYTGYLEQSVRANRQADEESEAGTFANLDVERIIEVKDTVSGGVIYDPKKQDVLSGKNGDRIIGKGLMGKLAKLATGIRNI